MATSTAAETIFSASELALSFGNHRILDGATIAVRAGEKVGLVGRNGCGKSSFLRILAGDEQPDAGSLSFKNGIVTGYLPQDFLLDDEATVEENIRAGAAELQNKLDRYLDGEDQLLPEIEHADGWNLETRIDTLTSKLSTPPREAIVGPLSGGEKRRVGLCRALVSQPDLLILDEPTNHLDAAAIEWLERYIAEMPGACFFVTHDRYFLDRIETRIAELDNGRFFTHEGNYSDYLVAKEERNERIEAAEKKRQSFLRREIEWVRAGVKARGTKQRSRLDNFYAVKSQKAPEKELTPDLVVLPPPKLGNLVAEISDAGVKIDDRWLFRGLNLELTPGECIGIVGPNGSGKTTMLRALMGLRELDEGEHRIGQRTEFNYVDQTRVALDEDKSVLEDVSGGVDYVTFGEERLTIRSYLKRFLFSDDRINDRIGNLSGGEKNRVLLAKILKRGGNVLVLDEPTNDLDLQTLRVLEEALINFPGTSLVVSHDRWFLDRVCDRVIVFSEGKVTISVGNYSYYLQKEREREARTTSVANKSKAKKTAKAIDADKPRKLTWKEERELEGIEEKILEAESASTEIESQLNDPEFHKEHACRVAAVTEQLMGAQTTVQNLYDRWEELEAIRKESESS